MRHLLYCLVLLVIISAINCTISPPKKKVKGKTKVTKELKVNTGPQSSSVFERNLIEEEPAVKDILVENAAYYRDTSSRQFNSTILGYVTPWNNHGYDVAKIWGNKFEMISPVWLQIIRKGKEKYEIGGTHDIDVNWIAELTKNGNTKILPRMLFDKFTDHDFSQLLSFANERQIVIKLIVDICHKYKFDGIVLEVWSTLSARVEDEPLVALVRSIAEELKLNWFEFVLVIPPARKEMQDLFSKKHFEALYPLVTAFSLMTYDYSSIQRPGANAPLYWVRNAVENICPNTLPNYMEKRKKILLGLNMYGNDFTPDGGEAIVGHQYLELLKHAKNRLQFDEHDTENFFDVKTPTGRHVVFYPTLHSIQARLILATELGTGISLWELGQGLDYFYDLF